MMGVLNCTPDSFSDGSKFNVEQRVEKARTMLEQGANIIDVGGESTRPNAQPVSLEDELARVIPVIQALPSSINISIDTMKAEVMYQAIMAGATMVNDVSALTYDAKSVDVIAESGVDICLMHMQGLPQNMQDKPIYHDVVLDVIDFFEQRIEACLAAGIHKHAILLDPGIGFGKSLADNLKLIANLDVLKRKFNLPIVLGTSRKSFLGLMTDADVANREVETAVSSAIGIFCGADVIRIHDCDFQLKTAIVAAQLHDYKKDYACS